MTQEGFKRKLTAILSADVEGYSRLMGENEEATVRTLTTYREVLTTLIQQHNGNVVDSPGDNLLAEFVSVVDAVQCAVAVQKEIKSRNGELPENRKMWFRIGINLGDVIQEKERIYGDGVNIAARLESLSEPGGICISKTTFEHVEGKLPYGYEFLGDQTIKNNDKKHCQAGRCLSGLNGAACDGGQGKGKVSEGPAVEAQIYFCGCSCCDCGYHWCGGLEYLFPNDTDRACLFG
jgi:class 3 adenylate cyclase